MKNNNCIYKYNLRKKKAFTLIELLIVIAIIGILFIVLVSRVDFATDKAKTTGVQTDFRAFQMAFEQVSKENAGFATFGWDTGDKSKDSLWSGKTTPNGTAYTYTNKDTDAGDRVKNSYDLGDANLNGIQESGETWVGRKIYTEEWTNVWTLTNPNGTVDYSAIAALEAAINANLDPKLHITINNDYTITMANQARDPWGKEYHGAYVSNALNDNMDRGAIILYSDGANGKDGTEHAISGGSVKFTIPGNNVDGQDDYAMVVVYSYVNGYGENAVTTTGFSNNQKFLAGNHASNLEVSHIQTLAGTTWKFKETITYDESVFGVFDYNEQTGWENFPDETYITNGSIRYSPHGLSIIQALEYTCFGTVQSWGEEWALGYFPENNAGIPSGWIACQRDFLHKFCYGQVTDMREAIPYLRPTSAPIIIFPPHTNALMEDPALIQWFYNNAELQ